MMGDQTPFSRMLPSVIGGPWCDRAGMTEG
jgi:hypothetical protein